MSRSEKHLNFLSHLRAKMLSKLCLNARKRFMLAPVLLLCACSAQTDPAVHPREAFGPIADAKKQAMTEFIAGKGSELRDYKAEVTEETDVEASRKYPYKATISFSYRISPVEKNVTPGGGSTEIYENDEFLATYRYSHDAKKWQYAEAKQADADKVNVFAHKDSELVKFEDVRREFEK